MRKIAEYQGRLLNHVETLYRPGERALAISLVEALGCAISDTGFKGDGDETFLAVHPEPGDRNMESNAFYMSPMRPEQEAVERRLKRLGEDDPELGKALAEYRATARRVPFGVAHFALRYPSGAAVQAVADRLAGTVAPLLGDRLHVRIFRPGDKEGAGNALVQGFVHQDVIVSGAFFYGQLIELQSRNV